jgi:hypothetical protein
MNFKEIELTTGQTVKVYAPPSIRIFRILEKKYPEPQKKIVTEKTATGREISMIIDDDPEYELEVTERDAKIDAESQELNILFALKDEKVPDDFSMESYLEILSYSNPDLKAREGRTGRKLDWIEWELLANPADTSRVQIAINDLISVDLEVVDQIERSFPDTVEGERS